MDWSDGRRPTRPLMAHLRTSSSQPSEVGADSLISPLVSEGGDEGPARDRRQTRPPHGPRGRAQPAPVSRGSAPRPGLVDDGPSPDAVHRLILAGPGPPPKRQAVLPRAESERERPGDAARDEFFDEFRKLRSSFIDRDEIDASPSPGSSFDGTVSFDATSEAAALWP